MSVELLEGDCLTVLPTLSADSIDSCVTDPPYHLVQNSRSGSPQPGDMDAPYGRSGPSKAKAGFMGKEWDGGDIAMRPEMWAEVYRVLRPGAHLLAFGATRTSHRMVCAIEDAGFEIRDTICWLYGSGFPKSHNLDGEWQGWGTALKPAYEPIIVARKPPIGTVAANVLAHGTGAINIDGCRIETDPSLDDKRLGGSGTWQTGKMAKSAYGEFAGTETGSSPLGRWPANVVHDGSDEVQAAFPDAPGQSGSAARFFYSAKATSEDRNDSNHPTVKPLALMRWLVKLVTPPGGRVLDPFAGSGTTGEACQRERFDAVLIEREPEYCKDIRRRLKRISGADTPLFSFGEAAQ